VLTVSANTCLPEVRADLITIRKREAMSTKEHQLITRRRSLALLSSSGAGLLIAGKGGFGTAFAKSSDGDDYVANGARACTLTAEHAAVDIWHCNASGVYSDISSENTVGETYLRGVQFTDKHGFVTFKSIFPGHYSGRTTHIHARIHIGSTDSGGNLTGGHIAHTGQMFPPDAVYGEVYRLSPYNAETATIVTHAEDRVWTDQHGSEAPLKIKKIGNRLSKGLTASVTLAVNPSATPALIGATSSGTSSSPSGTTPTGTPPSQPGSTA
jgi:hypothetical protein